MVHEGVNALENPTSSSEGFPGTWTKSYYSNTYLGSSGEGSHAANLSGLLLDLFPRSGELMVEQSKSSWRKPLQSRSWFSALNTIMRALEMASPKAHCSP